VKLAYVVSMFPCWSETFILNELLDHRSNGLKAQVLSLKLCNESKKHDDAIPIIPDTLYPPNPWSWEIITGHICYFLKNPIRYTATLFSLFRMQTRNIEVHFKALAVFWLAGYFAKEVKKNSIEHLHAHFATYPALLAWIISRFVRISFTITAHAHDIYVDQGMLKLVAPHAGAIVTISEFNRNLIRKELGDSVGKKTEVIHCGIELKRFQFIESSWKDRTEERKLQLLSIGRLSGIKGFSYLIRAVELLCQEGVGVECRIVGDGPLREQLLALVHEKGLEKSIRFLGACRADEIHKLFKEADLFVLACARDPIEGHDGIPVVFMEAMAYGVPVIGTKLSGIPELIRQDDTGTLAESEDAASIKEMILAALRDPNKLDRMRRNGRLCVEKEFNIKKNGKRLRMLFSEISDIGAKQ
jgi:colanic acid/amylovoran biosynthesis glycosyltransferase